MAVEIEAKFRVAELDSVRVCLQRAGGERGGQMLEHNRIYDTAEHRLRGEDCGLRLRWRSPLDAGTTTVSDDDALLTFKGPRQPGPMKTREELESPVGDPDQCAAILQRLGFREVITYETRRETWTLANCTVTLDELPRLGTWVEIEGPDEHAVDGVRDRLRLAPDSMASETYVEMAAESGVVDADGCRRLLFDQP
jgi:adenylate cyclase class 2